MKNTVFFLSTCSTNQRIMKALDLSEFELIDIKPGIKPIHLEKMHELSGSYEALFSRVAMKYKAWGLKEMDLGEEDYKKYILEEYTFLKRPVFIIEDEIFIGNSKKNVQSITEKINSL